MTDYKLFVQDLYALTHKTSDGQWTSAHTASLNSFADEICNCMKLGLVDLSKVLHIHVGI